MTLFKLLDDRLTTIRLLKLKKKTNFIQIPTRNKN